MSRFAAMVQTGENPGIIGASSIARAPAVGQMPSFSYDLRVARATRRLVTLCLVVHAAGSAAGCTDVNGGGRELSWKLSAATGSTGGGDAVRCPMCEPLPGTGEVAKIRIDWEGDAGSGSKLW